MNSKVLKGIFLIIFTIGINVKSFSQRSNYNEQDVVMMRNQQSVGTNIMKLLENKKIDSCLFYFKDKSAATKKKLSKISTTIQQFKGKHVLAVSPDAPDNEVNHIICKYTSEDGVTTYYKVLFVFGRFDTSYKANSIIL